MKLIDMIETLNMVLPYYDDPTDYVFGAEHDQIFLYATDRPLSPERYLCSWTRPRSVKRHNEVGQPSCQLREQN